MSVKNNLLQLLEKIRISATQAKRKPEEITLVVVSKQRSIKEIEEVYAQGIRDFAENRVQEALEKIAVLPPDIRWHFIGKIQKNKISKILLKFFLVQSVDSFALASALSTAGLKRGTQTPILLEANTSGEESKSGLTPAEWNDVWYELFRLEGITIKGLMTMAPLTEDEAIIRHTFSELRLLRDRLEEKNKAPLPILSMGMSNDFAIAIQEGATHLRIGTAIFTPVE